MQITRITPFSFRNMRKDNSHILLINPNRYCSPPVIPVGLEYVASSLEGAGYNTRMLDLCFTDDHITTIHESLRDTRPLFAGITIRNIDSALYNNNIFFLPDIARIIDEVKKFNIPVVLGGAGFSGAPDIILSETGADFGITGPADIAVKELADTLSHGARPEGNIISGWNTGIDSRHSPKRPLGIDYKKYIDNGGVVGFATQFGCSEHCPYCLEAGKRVLFRDPEAVISELAFLSENGHASFHLCDSEYNLDLGYSERFAEMLAEANLSISWALYLKPAPWSEKLFSSLKRSGAVSITLSVDSFILSSSISRYNNYDVVSIIRICRELGIKLAVDLLTGYPRESVSSTAASMELFRKHRPDTVGVNSFFRIYPDTELRRFIDGNNSISILANENQKNSAVKPAFYNHITIEKLHEIIDGDPLFRIEGFERSTNYERLRSDI